jgi:GABA(A) receptor-associated protein
MEIDFKIKFSFDERKEESSRLMKLYKNRIPIIIDKLPSTKLNELDRKKYLFINTMLISDIYNTINNRLNSSYNIYFGMNKEFLSILSIPILEIYNKYRDEDGFLYCYYGNK